MFGISPISSAPPAGLLEEGIVQQLDIGLDFVGELAMPISNLFDVQLPLDVVLETTQLVGVVIPLTGSFDIIVEQVASFGNIFDIQVDFNFVGNLSSIPSNRVDIQTSSTLQLEVDVLAVRVVDQVLQADLIINQEASPNLVANISVNPSIVGELSVSSNVIFDMVFASTVNLGLSTDVNLVVVVIISSSGVFELIADSGQFVELDLIGLDLVLQTSVDLVLIKGLQAGFDFALEELAEINRIVSIVSTASIVGRVDGLLNYMFNMPTGLSIRLDLMPDYEAFIVGCPVDFILYIHPVFDKSLFIC